MGVLGDEPQAISFDVLACVGFWFGIVEDRLQVVQGGVFDFFLYAPIARLRQRLTGNVCGANNVAGCSDSGCEGAYVGRRTEPEVPDAH